MERGGLKGKELTRIGTVRSVGIGVYSGEAIRRIAIGEVSRGGVWWGEAVVMSRRRMRVVGLGGVKVLFTEEFSFVAATLRSA